MIVAVKGIGGYHLACRADDEDAVARLRRAKHREERPFALLARDLDAARALLELTAAEEDLLVAPQRPIVLARRRADATVARSVAPRSAELGVMLPYAPLHHLLVRDVGATLVLTSGNISDEPIAYRDADALERLAGIAERFLVHDRPIHIRTDDSVLRAVSEGPPLLLRRSRGYVPAPLALPIPAQAAVLGCGAELKSTFCLARGARAWVGHHIGDLRGAETLRAFAEGIAHFEDVFAVRPEVVACDLHPDYLSTGYARERVGVRVEAIQHHHAHLAACLAEHGEVGPALGAIFDGAGLGPDGTVWGGELLAGDLAEFERVGHLWPVRLPGGDRAAREPWRMACAWLVEALGTDEPPLPRTLRGAPAWGERMPTPESWRAVARMASTGFAAPLTTSVGRLFDAIAALCGLRASVTYEGQAAAELEAACERSRRDSYPLPVTAAGVLDARVAVLAAADDVRAGVAPGVIAGRFHRGLAAATAQACAELAGARGLDTIVLAGGVFQNRVLLEATAALLAARGLRVLRPQRLPPGDGGISYGQVAVAAARVAQAPQSATTVK